MAEVNSTKRNGVGVCSRNQRLRASERSINIKIDLAASGLKDLMTEQYRCEGRHLTVYRGSRDELTASGIPESVFPEGKKTVKRSKFTTINACCTGRQELLAAEIRLLGEQDWELEVDWGGVRPYMQGSHHAVHELARMLLIDMLEWSGDTGDLCHPMRKVAAHPRADYMPGKRVLVSTEFQAMLRAKASELFEFVYSHCEVYEVPDDDRPTQSKANLRLITTGV